MLSLTPFHIFVAITYLNKSIYIVDI